MAVIVEKFRNCVPKLIEYLRLIRYAGSDWVVYDHQFQSQTAKRYFPGSNGHAALGKDFLCKCLLPEGGP